MTVESASPEPDFFGSAISSLQPTPKVRERTFWAALVLVTILHSSLFLYASRSMQRVAGEREGVDDPIAASILTEEEFLQATGQTQPANAQKPQLKDSLATETETENKREAEKPIEKREEPKTEFTTETIPEALKEPETKAKAPSSDDVAGSLAAETGDLLKLPEAAPAQPRNKPGPKEPQQAKPSESGQKIAKLDLGIPKPGTSGPMIGGRSPSFSRPAGITRSGENDEFGRGVLKAMHRAMSSIRAPVAAIVLRTLLDENGNVKSVKLIEGDEKAGFTQELMFAIRTATYPFPPRPSTVADRTFEVLFRYR